MLTQIELYKTKEYWVARVHIQIWNDLWWCPSWLALYMAKKVVNKGFMEDIRKLNVR